MSIFKHVLKHSAIYGMANILSRVIGFAMIPVYTRFLTPQDYGVIELLDLTISVISTLIGIRMTAAIFRYYYEYKDEGERNELMSTAILSGCYATFGVAVVCSLFSRQFSQVMFKTEAYSHYFLVVFATLFFQILIEYCFVHLQVRQQSMKYGLISLARLFIGLSLNIVFVVHLRQGPLGILYSGLVTSVLVGLYLGITTFSQTKWGFSRQKLGIMMKFSAPLILSSGSTFVLTFSDRYFLNHFAPLSEVGIYALGYKFGILVSFVITGPFFSIWSPKRFETAARADSEKISTRAFTYFSIVVVFVSLAMSAVIRDVLYYLATPEFYSAYKVVPVVVLGYVFNSWYYHFNYGIYMSKQTKYIAYIWISAAVLNLGLNWFLIKHFHGMGAAVATALAYLYVSLATYAVSQRLIPMRYELGKVGMLLVMGAGIYFLTLPVHIDTPWLSGIVKSCMVMLFPLAVYFGGILDRDEKAQLKETVAGLAVRFGIGKA